MHNLFLRPFIKWLLLNSQGVENATRWITAEKVYQTKCISVGRSKFIYEETGWNVEALYRL